MSEKRGPRGQYERSDQAEINSGIFHDRAAVDFYASAPIKPAEVVLFLRFISAFQERAVLDLGVGAGRTTQYLLRFARRYVGVDNSNEMLAACASRFPGAELVLADVRDLSVLGGDQFDFILASYGLLDGLSHSDREAVLRDTRERLVPGGVFAFSAHNRAHLPTSRGPQLALSRNPLTQLRLFLDYLRSARNHRRIKPFEEHHETHALINDISHQWSGLVYYIDRPAQEAQLLTIGYTVLTVLDGSGTELRPEETGRTSSELYYVCSRR